MASEMIAVILNSGVGRRLGKLTADKPKCLIEIDGPETILSRQIRMLDQLGVSRIVLTTGPFAFQLQEYVKIKFPGLSIIFVNNPRFDSTNYIYSLFLARDVIEGPVLLLHGDMVFSFSALEKLGMSAMHNKVLARKNRRLPEKDFKGRIQGDRVTRISVTLKGKDCLEIFPIYRLSGLGWKIWMEEIERWVNRGCTDVYAEEAFNQVSKELLLEPVLLGNLLCMEIDTITDLEKARNRLRGKRKE